MGLIIDTENFNIIDFVTDDDDNEKSLFDEVLEEFIVEWQKSSGEPVKQIELFHEYSEALLETALQPVPCWQPQDVIHENGLFQTKTGVALVHNGYFVMLKDLVERLPRILGE